MATNGKDVSAEPSSDDDGLNAPLDYNTSWVTALEAAKRYGTQTYHVIRVAERGRVRRKMGTEHNSSRKIWRYCPEDLAEYFEASQVGAAEDELGASALLSALTQVVKTQAEQAREMFRLYTEDRKQTTASLTEQCTMLAGQVRDLHKSHWESVKLREQMLNEQHSRGMATTMLESQEKRRAEAFGVFKEVVPHVVQQVRETLGINGNPAAKAAIGLFESLERQQLEALLATDFVTEEQKVFIREFLKHAPKPEPKPEAKSETAQEPAPSEVV